jgi:hypothetical protein
MKINETEGTIVFDNLLSVDRDLGSNETITVQKPAAKPVAANAKGVFEDKELLHINEAASAAAKKLSTVLTA